MMESWKRMRCPECDSHRLRLEELQMQCQDCASYGPAVSEPVLGEGTIETMERAYAAWKDRVKV